MRFESFIFFSVIVYVTSDICGNPKFTGYIIGGKNITRNEIPWMVALKDTRTTPPSFFCGATLISKNHALTAAHCIQPKQELIAIKPKEIQATFGAYDLKIRNELGSKTSSPSEIHVHPDWDPHSIPYDADIAMLKFRLEVPITQYIQPICLWKGLKAPSQFQGYVAGWGKSEDTSKKHETIPKVISAPIQENEHCLPQNPHLAHISSNRTFCAGSRTGTGVCLGDSGSSLVIKVGNLNFIRGIVSSSLRTLTSCDVTNFAVFTDVLRYKSWIDQVMSGRETSTISVKDACKDQELFCETFGCSRAKPKPASWPAYRASVGEFPFAVALGYDKVNFNDDETDNFLCNGVLISEKFVITAAHCTSRKSNPPNFVRLGKTLFTQQNSEDSSPPVDVAIKAVVRHPNYSGRKKLNDIALLELISFVNFNDKIRPACLNYDASNRQRELTNIGSGHVSFSDGVEETEIAAYSAIVKRSANEILLKACVENLGMILLSPDHLCATNYFNNDICQGSSGGFLGTNDGNFHVIHGISSFGFSCGSNRPSVFTRIASYTDWIEEMVWPKAESIQRIVESENQTGDGPQDIENPAKIPVKPYNDKIIFPQ